MTDDDSVLVSQVRLLAFDVTGRRPGYKKGKRRDENNSGALGSSTVFTSFLKFPAQKCWLSFLSFSWHLPS
jgi:hypothetical protein